MQDEVLELLQTRVDRRIGPDDIDIVPDQHIASLYAVRTGEGADYLVNTLAKAVEKVRFSQWPPR